MLDSDYDHSRCSKFVKNLLKRRKEWLFQFVINPDVEPTNNRAERALRPSVIYRKTSGGSRSERGAEIYTKLYSIYYTSKLRKKNFINDVPKLIRKAKPGRLHLPHNTDQLRKPSTVIYESNMPSISCKVIR